MNNEQEKKTIANEENLKDATGGFGPRLDPREKCPCCGVTFKKKNGKEIGGVLYCPTCWDNKEKLNIPGAYPTETGAAGGW